jgi:type VI secretion system secreted protein Hcp
MAVDTFLVIPSAAIGMNAPPLVSDPIQDAYFSQTYGKPGAAVVQLRSFSLSAENPTTVGSATSGAGMGKAKFNELTIEKAVDRLSPTLFVLSASGAHFPTVQIFIRKAGGGGPQPGKPYLGYEFSMVFVTKLQWSGDEGDDVPVEQVSFAYGSLSLGYYPQQPDGSFGKVTKLGWSQMTNTALASDGLTNF